MQNVGFEQIGSYFLYGWLLLVLLIAAVSDLRYRRIPNLLTLPTILLAMLVHLLIGGLHGLLFSVSGFLLAFILFVIPYATGGMGAGDVKLMSAVGAVFGWQNTLITLLFIALTGGVIALVSLLRNRTLKTTLTSIFFSFILLLGQRRLGALQQESTGSSGNGIPYGVAITTGTYLFLLYMYLINNNIQFVHGGA